MWTDFDGYSSLGQGNHVEEGLMQCLRSVYVSVCLSVCLLVGFLQNLYVDGC